MTKSLHRALALTAVGALIGATTSGASARHDTGVYACQAIVEAHQTGRMDWAITWDVRYGLRWSANALLREAGAEFDRVARMPEDDQFLALNGVSSFDLAGVIRQELGPGCAAVGAPLPQVIIATGSGPI